MYSCVSKACECVCLLLWSDLLWSLSSSSLLFRFRSSFMNSGLWSCGRHEIQFFVRRLIRCVPCVRIQRNVSRLTVELSNQNIGQRILSPSHSPVCVRASLLCPRKLCIISICLWIGFAVLEKRIDGNEKQMHFEWTDWVSDGAVSARMHFHTHACEQIKQIPTRFLENVKQKPEKSAARI